MIAENTANDNKDTFKPGSLVELRSGGPVMTVIDIGFHSGQVLCKWIVAGDTREAFFPASGLSTDGLIKDFT